jgi:hypothetical protein
VIRSRLLTVAERCGQSRLYKHSLSQSNQLKRYRAKAAPQGSWSRKTWCLCRERDLAPRLAFVGCTSHFLPTLSLHPPLPVHIASQQPEARKALIAPAASYPSKVAVFFHTTPRAFVWSTPFAAPSYSQQQQQQTQWRDWFKSSCSNSSSNWAARGAQFVPAST